MAAVAVAAVAVLVLGGLLLARPGGLMSVRPCDAGPGSTLPGFDDVVGPRPLGGPGSVVSNPFPGGQFCSYATAGVSPESVGGVDGRLVILLRAPRAAVEADPQMSEAFRGAASGDTSSSAAAYPVSLPRSGVTIVATQGTGGAGSSASATCVAGPDYWSVSVLSYASRDNVGAVDALLVALGCGPVPDAT